MGIQLSPEGVHGCDGIWTGDCPGISIGLGLGAALRFLLLCAAFLVALRADFLAFPRAFFRATRSPPLLLTYSFLRLVGPLQQTSAGVLPQPATFFVTLRDAAILRGVPVAHMQF